MENRKTRNDELERLTEERFRKSEKIPIVIVLDNVRSLHNVGSVFRTADAFRLQAIHICGHTGTPPNKEISKTALGATETVEWKYFSNTHESVEFLRQMKYKICSVEQTKNSIMLNRVEFSSTQSTALIFGNEVYGVQESLIALSDMCIEIPQIGFKHSLNISVSVGIVAWELSKNFLDKISN